MVVKGFGVLFILKPLEVGNRLLMIRWCEPRWSADGGWDWVWEGRSKDQCQANAIRQAV